MKKILSLLLVLCLSASLLVSCGNGNNTNAPETDETKAPETTAPPEPTFKLPELTMGEWCVQYMRDMANIKWSPATNIDTTSIAKELYYNKGKIYYGLPYINLSTDADLYRFKNDMTWNEEKQMYIYETATNRHNTQGNDCSSAVFLAWKRFDSSVKAIDTGSCFPLGTSTGVLPLGNLASGNLKETKPIIQATNHNDYLEALALLKKGDMILQRSTAGHCRMVIDVHIERFSNGKIDANKSYVTTIEQTNAFDKTKWANGKNTTWWVDHEYTFVTLKNTNYIPVTCKMLRETLPEPKVTKSSFNTQKTILTLKNLSGSIVSNYNILNVFVYIKDAEGNILYTATKNVRHQELSKNFLMSSVPYAFDMSTLQPGSYTYSVEIETVCGTGEIYSLNFNK